MVTRGIYRPTYIADLEINLLGDEGVLTVFCNPTACEGMLNQLASPRWEAHLVLCQCDLIMGITPHTGVLQLSCFCVLFCMMYDASGT